jgi:hypothetical protein
MPLAWLGKLGPGRPADRVIRPAATVRLGTVLPLQPAKNLLASD